MHNKQQVQDLLRAGHLEEAKKHCERLCKDNKKDAEAWVLLGAINNQLGNIEEAERCCRKAATIDGTAPETKFNLASILFQQGKHDAAREILMDLLRTKADFPLALCLLGMINHTQGHLEKAEEAYRKAISIDPTQADYHAKLGVTLYSRGLIAESLASFEKALIIQPQHREALFQAAAVFTSSDQFAKAEECYRYLVTLEPAFTEARVNLAYTLQQLNRYEEAAKHYEQALSLRPDSIHAKRGFFATLGFLEKDNFNSAMEHYQAAIRAGRADWATIRHTIALPVIVESNEFIETRRKQIKDDVSALIQADLLVKEPASEISNANFLLAYHGKNDRKLKSLIAQLHLHTCPSLKYTAPHCQEAKIRARFAGGGNDRIRLGFISRNLNNHSVGRTSMGIIKNFSRDRFIVITIFIGPPADETARFIESHADEVIILPPDMDGAHQMIADSKLDILFYQDIGMDPLTYFLSFARLAPIQCASFGHPETTGVPNIDYYISTDAWEPADGDCHYSEKLIRLRDVGSVAYYYRPVVPEPLKPREYYGLSSQAHIYACPQTLFKFHPDFDLILGEILRRDPLGSVILIEGNMKGWTASLEDRFHRSIPDVAGRIRFLPRQVGTDFINLIAVSDVMLDTIYFCGFNTTLEAFSVGVPVVTLPGEFMRSRHTLAFYRKMNIMDCVAKSAEDYIDIAVRLATDKNHRNRISNTILERNDILFEEIRVVHEFERVFKEAFQELGQSVSIQTKH